MTQGNKTQRVANIVRLGRSAGFKDKNRYKLIDCDVNNVTTQMQSTLKCEINKL